MSVAHQVGTEGRGCRRRDEAKTIRGALDLQQSACLLARRPTHGSVPTHILPLPQYSSSDTVSSGVSPTSGPPSTRYPTPLLSSTPARCAESPHNHHGGLPSSAPSPFRAVFTDVRVVFAPSHHPVPPRPSTCSSRATPRSLTIDITAPHAPQPAFALLPPNPHPATSQSHRPPSTCWSRPIPPRPPSAPSSTGRGAAFSTLTIHNTHATSNPPTRPTSMPLTPNPVPLTTHRPPSTCWLRPTPSWPPCAPPCWINLSLPPFQVQTPGPSQCPLFCNCHCGFPVLRY